MSDTLWPLWQEIEGAGVEGRKPSEVVKDEGRGYRWEIRRDCSSEK